KGAVNELRHLHAELRELALDHLRPAAIRVRIRRARMQDAADAARLARKRRPRPLLGEAADADHERGLERADDGAQRVVARREERLLLRRGKLVGRPVTAALLDERERAIVRDEEAREEALRRAEAIPCPSPEAR